MRCPQDSSREWTSLTIDDARTIQFTSPSVYEITDTQEVVGSALGEVFPWFRPEWLNNKMLPRLVKTSLTEKLLLEIIPDETRSGWLHIFFRSLADYCDTEHLWCEVAGSIIGVQRFIDTSYDGMVVADGQGKVLAVNEAFLQIAGIARRLLVGRYFQELVEEGLMPYSCTLEAIEQHKSVSAVIKYPKGKEAIVSSTPLTDNHGAIVRVLSNVRDITELESLHEKLKSAKALANGFRRELKAIQAARVDTNMNLARSRVMETLYDLIAKVAGTDLQLLITGESGVGKTALAKFVHMSSERSISGNFIHVNCSAIPETLLESELFGYEEGSFTGAKKAKVGLFEMANKGTLFLDEIGDMPLKLQAKLLNVLQEGKFYRVGGLREVSVDVRLITATNMPLTDLISKGLFRQDLYYRLNVVPIRIPALAERREDIPPLVAHYLEISNKRYKKRKVLAPEAMEALLRYNWPGNIRELINLVERLVVIIDDAVIEQRHLPADILTNPAQQRNTSELADGGGLWQPSVSLKDTVAEIEKQIIEEALEKTESLKDAAQMLGVDVTTLIRKRKK